MVFSAVANYWREVCSVLEFSARPHAEANGIPRMMAVGSPRIAFLLRAWRMVVWVEAGASRVPERDVSKTELRNSCILVF